MTAENMPADGQLTIGSVRLPAGKQVHATTWSMTPDGTWTGVGDRPVAWITLDSVPDAGRVWAALSAAHAQTGLVPFVLGTLSGDPSRPWDQEEFEDPMDPRMADQVDAARVLTERWEGETEEDDDPEFAQYLAPYSGRFPGLAAPTDTALSPQELDEALGSVGARRLGLVPAGRPADVLPLIGWTPSDQSDALPIAAEHWAFADECDDIGRGTIGEITTALLARPASWQFWWD
jgi:hypothetical protein